jgi:hypothetical protein
MMGELALRYPPQSLVVSTGAYEGSAESDARFPQPIANDLMAIDRKYRLPTLSAASLARGPAAR